MSPSDDEMDRAADLALEVIEELRDETDRALAVLGGAKLDHKLRQVLERFLLPSTTNDDDLFQANGPLATFSSRISMTYRLGLVDADFCRLLNKVRKIRNDFAHSASGASLSDRAMNDRVKDLVQPFNASGPFQRVSGGVLQHDGKAERRAEFITLIAFMMVALDTLVQKVERVAPSRTQSVLGWI